MLRCSPVAAGEDSDRRPITFESRRSVLLKGIFRYRCICRCQRADFNSEGLNANAVPILEANVPEIDTGQIVLHGIQVQRNSSGITITTLSPCAVQNGMKSWCKLNQTDVAHAFICQHRHLDWRAVDSLSRWTNTLPLTKGTSHSRFNSFANPDAPVASKSPLPHRPAQLPKQRLSGLAGSKSRMLS